jgi:NAD(P)-dependent dehydrogenase (short-subunit alcohol dehydrogenase family)
MEAFTDHNQRIDDMTKVWFITGAASGIGAGAAKAALDAGEYVVATDLNSDRLHELFTEHHERVLLAKLDICDHVQAKDVVDAAISRFGRIDVLLNNAGYGQFGAFEEVDIPAIERQFATNVFGTFNVTRAVLPVMRQQRSGHIFNMSSNGGFVGVGGASMYSATKFAIEGFSESIALELAQFSIKVTIVEPGAFRTDFLDERSLRYGTTAIADYAEYWGKAKAVFVDRNHRQLGDPSKLGQALIALAATEEPPLRFVAGSDALAKVAQKLSSVHSEIELWNDLSNSTDGDV